MSYLGFLARHPHFWGLVVGLCAGGMVASATRFPSRSRDPRRARSRKVTVVSLWATVAVGATAAALILVPGLGALARANLVFASIVGGVAFAALRFPRAVGIPVVVIVGILCVAGASIVAQWQAVRSPVTVASLTVLSIDDERIAVEVGRGEPGADTQIVHVDPPTLRAYALVIDASDSLFLLGARRFAVFLGLAPVDYDALAPPVWLVDAGLVSARVFASDPVRPNLLHAYNAVVDAEGVSLIRVDRR